MYLFEMSGLLNGKHVFELYVCVQFCPSNERAVRVNYNLFMSKTTETHGIHL